MINNLDIVSLDPYILEDNITLLANYNGTDSISISPGSIQATKGALTNFSLLFQTAVAFAGTPSDATPSGWTKILTDTSNTIMRTSVFYKTGPITTNITGGLNSSGEISKVYFFKVKNLTPSVTVEDSGSSGTTTTPTAQEFSYAGGNISLGFAFKSAYNSADATITSDITPKYTDESTITVFTSSGSLRVNLYPYNLNAPTINISSGVEEGSSEIIGGGYVSFS